MKTFYIAILLFLCLALNAQVDVGVKGGFSISNLDASKEQRTVSTSQKGIYGGLVFSFHLSPSVYLQPEIDFSKQGGQQKGLHKVPANITNDLDFFKGSSLYADYKSATILNYLELPVLVKVLLGKRFKYYACFGPYIAFLINAKTIAGGQGSLYADASGTTPLIKNDSPYPTIILNNTINIKENIKTINAGVQGGLGIQAPAGAGNIFLEGRTTLGVSNIQSHKFRDGKNQTGSLEVAAGYLIKIK